MAASQRITRSGRGAEGEEGVDGGCSIGSWQRITVHLLRRALTSAGVASGVFACIFTTASGDYLSGNRIWRLRRCLSPPPWVGEGASRRVGEGAPRFQMRYVSPAWAPPTGAGDGDGGAVEVCGVVMGRGGGGGSRASMAGTRGARAGGTVDPRLGKGRGGGVQRGQAAQCEGEAEPAVVDAAQREMAEPCAMQIVDATLSVLWASENQIQNLHIHELLFNNDRNLE